MADEKRPYPTPNPQPRPPEDQVKRPVNPMRKPKPEKDDKKDE